MKGLIEEYSEVILGVITALFVLSFLFGNVTRSLGDEKIIRMAIEPLLGECESVVE